MRALITRFTIFYGANPLHLLGTIAAWALAGYVVIVLGPHTLWNPIVWWQSIAVWFLAAIIAHDLVLFPLYALADRSFAGALAAVRGRWKGPSPWAPQVSPLNYVRVPTLAAGLSLLLFFPGIIQQGQVDLSRGDRSESATLLWALVALGRRALRFQRAGLCDTTRGRRAPPEIDQHAHHRLACCENRTPRSRRGGCGCRIGSSRVSWCRIWGWASSPR